MKNTETVAHDSSSITQLALARNTRKLVKLKLTSFEKSYKALKDEKHLYLGNTFVKTNLKLGD